MNVYDQAHALADALKKSDAYLDYQKRKEVVYQDPTNKALLDEYKKLAMRVQVAMAAGGKADAEEMDRLQKIIGLLQYNPETAEFLVSEFRFQRMLTDIYKILGDVAGIDLDMLQGN